MLLFDVLTTGWEQPTWFVKAGDKGGYHPSYRRTNWFEPVGREVKAVMETAGVIDLTPFGKLQVSGPDASKFIDYICANTVPEVIILNDKLLSLLQE